MQHKPAWRRQRPGVRRHPPANCAQGRAQPRRSPCLAPGPPAPAPPSGAPATGKPKCLWREQAATGAERRRAATGSSRSSNKGLLSGSSSFFYPWTSIGTRENEGSVAKHTTRCQYTGTSPLRHPACVAMLSCGCGPVVRPKLPPRSPPPPPREQRNIRVKFGSRMFLPPRRAPLEDSRGFIECVQLCCCFQSDRKDGRRQWTSQEQVLQLRL